MSTSTKKTRTSYRKLRREGNPETPFRLQPRDLELLQHVARHRLLRTSHLLTLAPTIEGGISLRMLQYRLTKLFRHGYLDRIKEPDGFSKNRSQIHAISTQGGRALREQGMLPGRMRRFSENNARIHNSGQIYHTLLVAGFLTAVEAACAQSDAHTFIPQHELAPEGKTKRTIELKDSEGRHLKAIPDQIFGIRYAGRGRVYYYLEADRCTEDIAYHPVRPTIEGKLRTYYQANRQAGTKDGSKAFAPWGLPTFQVLFLVEENPRNRRHTFERVFQTYSDVTEGGRYLSNLCLFARHTDELLADPLGAPWLTVNGEHLTLGR